MKKIVDYVILENANLNELQRQVQEKIKEGWQPYGSLQAATPVMHGDEVAPSFIQPVVVYSTTDL
jgi:hypothetical protein